MQKIFQTILLLCKLEQHIVFKYDGTQPDNATRLTAKLDGDPVTLNFTGTVGATTSPTATTFYGGVDSDGSTNFWDGEIGELLIFTRTLSDGQIATIENYFTTKWAI